MKKLLLSLYNLLFPLVISIISLSSIFSFDFLTGILLFFNSIIFGYIFYYNMQLSSTYDWNNADIDLMNLNIIKTLLKAEIIKEKYNELKEKTIKEEKHNELLKKYKK